MLSADKLRARDARRRRAPPGRRAFIYNGMLPAHGHADAGRRSARPGRQRLDRGDDGDRALVLLGVDRSGTTTTAAAAAAIDPFVTAESFHNDDGDAALGDGLLLYPGRQQGKFAASSLGTDAVLPSMRLKAIRRGIQDAGLIALAAREQPEETARLIARALPAAWTKRMLGRPRLVGDGAALFEAGRAALRALVTREAPMTDAEIRAAFDDLAERRRRAVPLARASGRGLRRVPIA